MVPASLLEGKEVSSSIAEGSQISTNAGYERNIFFFWVAYILDCHHLIRDSSSKDGSRGRLASSIDDSDDIATLYGSSSQLVGGSVELSLHFTSSHLGGEGESADSHVENMQPRQTNLKVEGRGPVISRPSLPPNKLEEGYIMAHMAAMTCC